MEVYENMKIDDFFLMYMDLYPNYKTTERLVIQVPSITGSGGGIKQFFESSSLADLWTVESSRSHPHESRPGEIAQKWWAAALVGASQAGEVMVR